MTDFKGSVIQTHFWVLPTKEGLQPLGLTPQTDPRWFLHINSPATHLGKFTGAWGGGEIPSLLDSAFQKPGEY